MVLKRCGMFINADVHSLSMSLSSFIRKHRLLLILVAGFIALMLIGEWAMRYINLDAVFMQAPVAARIIFLCINIIEVIIAPIPGGFIGYLGAIHFGFWHAWGLLYAANLIGTTIVFFLARRLGAPYVEKNTSNVAQQRYNDLFSKRPWMLYAVYAVPVFPIDTISILAGVSKISFKRFVRIAYLGLISYTAIVAFIGSYFGDFIPFVEQLTFATLGIIVIGILVVAVRWNKRKKKEKK